MNASGGAGGSKPSRKRKRVQRKSKRKPKHNASQPAQLVDVKTEPDLENEENVEYEYVSEMDVAGGDPAYAAFKDVFKHFSAPEELCNIVKHDAETIAFLEKQAAAEAKADAEESAGKEKPKADAETTEQEQRISKRERKKQKRLSVAYLKQLVDKPEVVEAWDVTAANPSLLVHLKSCRNAVPVPKHWCQKRKFLQGKRGLEKPPFELPDFIAATGISRIRQTIMEQDEQKRSKQKGRERLQPRMGRMDIDYQVLHDAFFKYQKKPRLTNHGDLYYEGKEFEVKLKEKKPGQLSDELKAALGMPEGAPPPWLINMQRYGPPPSYSVLKIPGLNAPLPPGAQFGYHPGGWGKPPVDQFGKPLYGDVYGVTLSGTGSGVDAYEEVDKYRWGEMAEEEEEESEEEEDSESEEEGEEEGDSRAPDSGLAPSIEGMETPTGMVTPDTLVLRKKVASESEKDREREEEPQEELQLYKVIKQQDAKVDSKAMFGSAHTYQISDSKSRGDSNVGLIRSQKTRELDFTLTPGELENLTDEVLKERFESRLQMEAEEKERSREGGKQDVSDMVAAHQKQQRAKQQQQKDAKDKKGDKYKNFF